MEHSLDNDFISLQAGYLRKKLNSLSLHHVIVNPNPEVREGDLFRAYPTLGYTSLDELSVSIIASIGAARFSVASYPVTAMLIPPLRESSGLLVNDKTGKLYTDHFWACRNGEFKYVATTSPVPIDGWDVAFDHSRNDPVLEPHFRTHKALFEITGDKHKTRQVLVKAEVQIPRGTLLDTRADVKADIEAFVARNSGIQGFVVKALHGAQGKQVSMFGLEDIEQVVEVVRGSQFNNLVLEERVLPHTPPEGLRSIASFYGVEKPDYNFRVITSLDRDDPKIIASEIRFQEMGNRPVNISLSARAARLNSLEDRGLTRKIHKTALEAIKAVCMEVLSSGERMLGIGGVDLMWSQSGGIPVLEVNSGIVGGFGTLCRLDRSPLEKIRDAMLPAYRPYLEEHFSTRETIPDDLRRLPQSKNDVDDIFRSYVANARYTEAQSYLLQSGDIFNNPIGVANCLVWVGEKLADKAGLDYINLALEQNPGDLRLILYKRDLLSRLD